MDWKMPGHLFFDRFASTVACSLQHHPSPCSHHDAAPTLRMTSPPKQCAMKTSGREGHSYGGVSYRHDNGGQTATYFSLSLEAPEEPLGHGRRFQADRFLSKPLRLVPVSHNPRLRHHRRQHMRIFQPVHVLYIRAIPVHLLAPSVIGMSPDAVDCHDAGR